MASDAPSTAEPEKGSTQTGEEPLRYGPLELQRLRKEDGRMLILYASRDEPEGDSDG